jgi:hypothetical protein
MSERPIRIKSVNVNRNNGRTHGILQTDDASFDILLIQEPWFDSVATLRSDTDPNGTPQLGFPTNNKWITLSPHFSEHERPKVCIYVNKQTINQTYIVNHIPPSTILSPNSMVIDILSPSNRKNVDLRIVNVYHDKPTSGHALSHIFSHPLDDNTPTLFLGDFNTHSPRWSLPHSTTSSWAHSFHEWMDSNGLETLNPTNEHTWSRHGSRPSIIDLGLANESARYFTNLSSLSVSWSLAVSDHAALLINFQPETETPPQDQEFRGFHIDSKKKEDWSDTFRSLIADHTILTSLDPTDAARSFHDAIMTSCQRHLDKIKAGPPKGAVWWNEDCTTKLHLLRSSNTGNDRRSASKTFRNTVREAKRTWAHQQLFENTNTNNIWNMARIRKGRHSQVLPPLKDTAGEIHSDTHTKATLLKNRFFPTKSNSVDIEQAGLSNPTPLTTRPWTPITTEEIHEALQNTSNKSAPGPSGINYKILKWAYDACPESLTYIFNLSLSTGVHVWKHATIVPVAKPNKPDYSAPKAYRPISLMECTGKLLEKVITRRITNDIAHYPEILPNNQFGSRPQHCTTDAALALVHRIQATRKAGYHAALLLFDISGFFDHIDANRARDVLRKKGFPPNMVNWIFSFLTDRTAAMRLDSTYIDPFPVPDGTPQGSPLSPILSAIFTSFLLHLSSTWTHSTLSLYVDDGAILSVSATPNSASTNAVRKLEETLRWLQSNGLMVDFDKTELMIFSPNRYRGPTTTEAAYSDPTGTKHLVAPTTRLRYLGFFLTPTLDWRPHVSIMAMRARSTIRGLSILGNSIRGLDLVHWKQVYLMYVIPILTYGAPVWFTGQRQKGLVNTLQVAQNEGIRKITGVFRTTPTAVTENMIGIAPIKYLLPRVLHSFRNRMIATNPNHLLHTIQTDDKYSYWRHTPPTNLTSLLHDLESSTYEPPLLLAWAHHNVAFSPPNPAHQITTLYHIPSTVDDKHVIHLASKTHTVYTLLRSFIGSDHTQALGLSVLTALRDFPTFTYHYVHTPSFEQKLTSLKPHRDSSLYQSIRSTLDSHPLTNFSFYQYYTGSRDSPNRTQRQFWNQRFSASPQPNLSPPLLLPRDSMWQKIKDEYVPIHHPSALACQIPDNGKPVAAIRGALKTHSRLITSTIIRIATGHCFDAHYSQRFRPQSDDITQLVHTHTLTHIYTLAITLLFQCSLLH